MSVRRSVALVLCLAPSVVSSRLSAQSATASPLITVPVPGSSQRFTHRKKLLASYDSVADSTHLAVVTHKGTYFLTRQRPRLTWSVDYPGQVPGAEPPPAVTLEFRTQAPQVALNSRLTIAAAAGQRLEVPSAGAFSDPGVQTWSHFMRFVLPSAALAAALSTDSVTISVGGITERLKPDQLNALRDLLARVGAWPPGRSARSGA
jgi:hypothetical protein